MRQNEDIYNFAIRMKKSKRIYKVTLEDSSHLREIGAMTFTPLKMVTAITGIVIVTLSIAIAMLTATPLRKILVSPSDVTAPEKLSAMARRLDTLQTLTAEGDSFLTNISRVFDITRTPTDSINAGVLLNSLPVDSLMTSTPAERRFVTTMGEHEKYNLQVLSPVAADGIIFSNPVDGGIVAEASQSRFMLRIIVPVGNGVSAIADGNVIDCYSVSATGTYNIVIQHPNGFVSRYSDVGTPLVESGSSVYSGQLISAPKEHRYSARLSPQIGIELWHDGTPLYPSDYIYRSERPNKNTHKIP